MKYILKLFRKYSRLFFGFISFRFSSIGISCVDFLYIHLFLCDDFFLNFLITKNVYVTGYGFSQKVKYIGLVIVDSIQIWWWWWWWWWCIIHHIDHHIDAADITVWKLAFLLRLCCWRTMTTMVSQSKFT